jgi:apoptosis-inducing factor 2
MKVVVIGGGIAGLSTCTSIRKFDKNVEITLVEPKEYMEVHWCSYRTPFDEQLAEKATFAIKKWAVSKSVTHVREKVMELTENHVALSNKENLEFNICVICTGALAKWTALGRGPPKTPNEGLLANRLKKVKDEGQKLLNAESVLVIGGGLIGCETAGDLAYFAKKAGKKLKVTLVHSGDALVPEFTPRAATMIQSKLEKLGVNVILNDKALQKEGDDGDAPWVLDSSGETIDAKEVVKTTGIFPCVAPMLRNPALKKMMDKKGWIQVDDYFRVKGYESRFFAIGDCCDLLPNAGNQVLGNLGVIGKNIKVLLDAIEADEGFEGTEKKMRKAVASPEIYVATVGKDTGVALTPCCHTQFMLPSFKNSSMFLFKIKGDLGLTE